MRGFTQQFYVEHKMEKEQKNAENGEWVTIKKALQIQMSKEPA